MEVLTCCSGRRPGDVLERPPSGARAELARRGGEGVLRQLVVLSVRSSTFQFPLTLTSCNWTVCVHDCAPSVVTVHSDPCGAGWVPLLTDLTLYCPNTTTVAASWLSLTWTRPTSTTSKLVVAETCW